MTLPCHYFIESAERVSSSLDKSTGKKNLIDNSPETCWASQQVLPFHSYNALSQVDIFLQGLPQFIQLDFPNRVIPKRLSIVFQGGFVGKRCAVYTSGIDSDTAWHILSHIYPEDVNRRQSFDLVPTQPELSQGGVSSVKLVFEESSDFFGRITVYDLKLEGTLNQ